MNITIDLRSLLMLVLVAMSVIGIALLIAYGVMSHDDDTTMTVTRARTMQDCLLAGAIMFPTGFVGSLVVAKGY